MSGIEGRLLRLENRQESVIAAVGDVAAMVAETRDLVRELMQWLQQPPSSDLPELLKQLVASNLAVAERVNDLASMVVALGGRVGDVPAAVVRALGTGEVR